MFVCDSLGILLVRKQGTVWTIMASLKSKIGVPEDVLFNDVGGEAVLLNLETGQYYGLDEVGTRMWSLLAECGQVEAACRGLLDRIRRDRGPAPAGPAWPGG